MGANVFKINATGAAAIQFSGTVPAGRHYRLVSVSCNFSAAPSTSENFTVTLDANAGTVYDTTFYSVNPSTASTTDILWRPSEEVILEGGDAVDVVFTNTDARTYAAQITFKAV